ncbi:MAG: hypothetical protein CW694_05450 [Candidatus Syntrophoarchaeum sp. WYZ-LMO15]|nr:MAG: hypothetical protein CW694_05450 [Candidatus Syntrophoarchaeum sp. WYZ-LMO15]
MGLKEEVQHRLKESEEEVSPEEVQESNVLISLVFEDIFRTLLGPVGASKLITKEMTKDDVRELVSNKGVAIVRELVYEHPAADMIMNAGLTQGEEVGDGVTSVFILLGELVKEGFELKRMGVHQNTIIKGYRAAADEAKRYLETLATVKPGDSETFQVALSALKMGRKRDIADAVVAALRRVRDDETGEIDVDDVTIIAESGEGEYSTEFFDGVIIDRGVLDERMPKRIEDARVLLLNLPLEKRTPRVKDLKHLELSISLRSPSGIKGFRDAERGILDDVIKRIIDSGANVVLCQQAVDGSVLHDLAEAGIMVLKRVKNTDMKRLSRVTGAEIIDNIEDINENSLGRAKLVYERDVGGEKMVFVEAPVKAASSIIIRGGTAHVLEGIVAEVKSSLSATKFAVEGGPLLPGGGAVEVELAEHLRTFARSFFSKEQLAIEAFADAIETIPEMLAKNCGMDPVDAIIKLRAEHAAGRATSGISALKRRVCDMVEEGILDPLYVKQAIINIATGTACALLNVDDLVIAKRELDTRLDIEKSAPEFKYKGGRIKYM